MQRHFQSKAGFTIIEIVVAMAVLVIGILALLPMLAINVRSNVASRTLGIANYLAQQKLEQIRGWHYYEDVDDTLGPFGITDNNTDLFGTEAGLTLNNWKVSFNRETTLVHNGYGSLNCNGISFDGSGSYNFDEGTFTNPDSGAVGLSLNSQNVNPCGSGSGYRGEDFKLVRVVVNWSDMFGYHEIARHMYISKF